MKLKKRELHELLYTEMLKSVTFRLASGLSVMDPNPYWIRIQELSGSVLPIHENM